MMAMEIGDAARLSTEVAASVRSQPSSREIALYRMAEALVASTGIGGPR